MHDYETPPDRGFMVGLLLVSLLRVEATVRREFMVVFISYKFLLLVK